MTIGIYLVAIAFMALLFIIGMAVLKIILDMIADGGAWMVIGTLMLCIVVGAILHLAGV